MAQLTISTYTCGPLETNCYLAVCRETKKTVIIDPAAGSEPQISKIIEEQELNLTGIWLTHSHWDHIVDCNAFRKKHGESLPISVHMLDKANLTSPGADGLPLPFPIEPIAPVQVFREGTILAVGTRHFQVFHTPGHSPGSCCFLQLGGDIFISGDTLFRGTYGNTSSPSSSPDQMRESLERIALLPDHIVVYPGHGPKTTIQKEKGWMKKLTGTS